MRNSPLLNSNPINIVNFAIWMMNCLMKYKWNMKYWAWRAQWCLAHLQSVSKRPQTAIYQALILPPKICLIVEKWHQSSPYRYIKMKIELEKANNILYTSSSSKHVSMKVNKCRERNLKVSQISREIKKRSCVNEMSRALWNDWLKKALTQKWRRVLINVVGSLDGGVNDFTDGDIFINVKIK